MLEQNIFREYDIRGIADRDMPSDGCCLPRPRARHLPSPAGRAKVNARPDVRLSGQRLRDALVEGLIAPAATSPTSESYPRRCSITR